MQTDLPIGAHIGSSASTALTPDINDKQSAHLFQQLFSHVYGQLRAMAQKQMANERHCHTLHATELVHEAYVRLKADSKLDLSNTSYFFHSAAEAMRRILVEHARRRGRLKRGGNQKRVTLGLADQALPQEPQEFLALDEALRRLGEKDPRSAEVVRLRFFAGLTIEQTADAMDLSPRTVKREWEFARAWLQNELQ
jgi:RNA polymerase sigma-70 factor (ECF subfamily)